MLRSLAYSIACALTGAASGLLVVHLAAAPAPTCPQAPVVELKQVATALARAQYVPPPPPPAPAAPPPELFIFDGAVNCPSEGHCVLQRDLVAQVFANPAVLAQQARVMPSVSNAGPRGFKFYGVRYGSLPQLIGMKNGDLLTAINGHQVRTLDDLLALLPRLRLARSIELDIERKGELVRLRLDIE